MARGGHRPGAGRPLLSGQYKEKTIVKRIPHSLLTMVDKILETYKDKIFNKKENFSSLKLLENNPTSLPLPLFLSTVSAGSPSPADDYVETTLDLNSHLISNPTSTFFVKASGESMVGVGIHSGDILIVDRSLPPKNNAIVIAVLQGDLTVKRLVISKEVITLMPENPAYPPIPISDESSLSIWGVVTNVIHPLS